MSGQDDRVVVHHVKGMTELSRVTDASDLPQVVSVGLEELDQVARAPVRKPEDHAMLNAMLGRILLVEGDHGNIRRHCQRVLRMTLGTPGGETLVISFADWIQVVNGKIARQRLYYDPRQFIKAFGM